MTGPPAVQPPLKHKRRCTQFSLRSAFVMLTLLCMFLVMVIVPAESRRQASAAIVASGGVLQYEGDLGDDLKWLPPAAAPWPKRFLRACLPRDYVDGIYAVVIIDRPELPEALLGHIGSLQDLRMLWLKKSTVTDSGFARLTRLKNLEWLTLDNTPITDAGLVHLRTLANLRELDLEDTLITDAGLTHLQGLVGLQSLSLRDTQITDAGLARLAALANLAELRLDRTRVTVAGISRLRQALPFCTISGP